MLHVGDYWTDTNDVESLVIVDMSTSLRMHNFIIMKTGSEKMKEIILEKFNEALEQTDSPKRYVEIADDQVLLESGLDSLGFAILVALLEEELDFDPFQEMENAVYPTTFGDFVAIYEQRKAYLSGRLYQAGS